MKTIFLLICCLFLIACSTSQDMASTQPTTTTSISESINTPSISQVIDFSRIEGLWGGEGSDESNAQFWIKVSIKPNAERNFQMGLVRYGLIGEETINCTGKWIALAADDPVYIMREQDIFPCPTGIIILVHDQQTETLRFDFIPIEDKEDKPSALRASGILRRSE